MKRTMGLKLGKQVVVWVLALIAIMACVVLAACSSGATQSSASASADADDHRQQEEGVQTAHGNYPHPAVHHIRLRKSRAGQAAHLR